LTLNADRIGPGLFIQHGVAMIVTAESIGSHCGINQQVTIGHNGRGRPTLGDHVWVGAGAMVDRRPQRAAAAGDCFACDRVDSDRGGRAVRYSGRLTNPGKGRSPLAGRAPDIA
jgi:hypothetical protein